jgi:hypothetical protein
VAYAEALAAVEQSRSTPELAMTARGDRAGTALARVRRILRGADEGTLRRGSLLAGTSAALVLVGAIAGYLAFTGKPTKAEIEATRNEATGESTTTTDDPPAQPGTGRSSS